MLSSQRVFWSDNGALKDLSVELNDLFGDSRQIDFKAASDRLFIGSDVPFNHRWLKVVTPNAIAASVTVEIWNGSRWVPAVDVVDRTATNGVPLAKSGILQWTTDRNASWSRESTTENMKLSGLESVKVYGLHWVRVTFSADVAVELKYLGYKFCGDADLGALYPDLNRANVKTAFAAGKTDWDDQAVLASEYVVDQLRSRRQAWTKGQIFGWETYREAAVRALAQIIFESNGKGFEEAAERAGDRFAQAVEATLGANVDADEDGHIDEQEQRSSSAGLYR